MKRVRRLDFSQPSSGIESLVSGLAALATRSTQPSPASSWLG
jgi:hypothetical protein